MKQKIFLSLISVTVLFASTAHANYSFNLPTAEACNTISGNWSGKGSASSWFIGRCDYHGTGTVSQVDEHGRFSVQVDVTKDSGSPLCPPRGKEQFNAVCKEGTIIITTEFGNLKGAFTAKNGHAEGTLAVSPGLEADVAIKMFR